MKVSRGGPVLRYQCDILTHKSLNLLFIACKYVVLGYRDPTTYFYLLEPQYGNQNSKKLCCGVPGRLPTRTQVNKFLYEGEVVP